MSLAADKYAGAIVGDRGKSSIDVATATRTAGVEDALVVPDAEGKTSVLTARINPGTGELVWLPEPDVEAAQNERVSRSQMASMLKDSQRCDAYEAAVTRVVQGFARSTGRAPTVLDIGAGTGLLSLIAARAGASSVTGIEQWPTMARIARGVVAEAVAAGQVAQGQVHILDAHSNDVTVGAKGLPCLADIVVSEIVDSALLGEGMLPALRDAYARLTLTTASSSSGSSSSSSSGGSAAQMCVPLRAEVHAQLVWSDVAEHWQRPSAVVRPGGNGSCCLLRATGDPSPCEAQGVAIPIHAARMQGIQLCSQSFTALTFDLTPAGVAALEGGREVSLQVPAATAATAADGPHGSSSSSAAASSSEPAPPLKANAVMFWWNLVLAEASDDGPAIVYSTAPAWVRGPGASTGSGSGTAAAAEEAWQDHWTQCLYPLPEIAHATVMEAGGAAYGYTVVSCHSDTRIWFLAGPAGAAVWPSKRTYNIAKRKGELTPAQAVALPLFLESQPCMCGLHSLCSVDRRWALDDTRGRSGVYTAAVDGLLRSLLTAKAGEQAALAADAGLTADDLGDATAALVLRVADVSDVSVSAAAAASSPAVTAPHRLLLFVPESNAGIEASVHLSASVGASASPSVTLLQLDVPVHELTPEHLGAAEAEAAAQDEEDEEEGDEEASQGQDAEAEEANVDAAAEDSASDAAEDNAEETVGGDAGDAGDGDDAVAPEVGDEVEAEEAPADGEYDDVRIEYTGPTALLDAVIGEPFFAQAACAPLWALALFWYKVAALRTAGCLPPSAPTLPYAATIMVQPVCFKHLHTGYGFVRSVRGFSHAALDAVQEGWHTHLFNLPLWQYEYTPCSDVTPVLHICIAACSPPTPGAAWVQLSGASSTVVEVAGSAEKPCPDGSGSTYRCGGTATFNLTTPHTTDPHLSAPNAVLVWVRYQLDAGGKHIVDCGPAPGNAPHYERVAVKFLGPHTPAPATGVNTEVQCTVYLDEMRGCFKVHTASR